MRTMFNVVAILAFALAFSAGVSVAAEPPAWAYAIAPAAPAGNAPAAPAAPDTSLKHLPGSTLEFTRAQISDAFGPADWYPGDHPKMPDVVAHGRRPDVRACSLCHYPNGKRPPRKRRRRRSPGNLFPPTDGRFQERQPQERGAAEGQYKYHDYNRQGHDRGRNQSRRRVLQLHEVDALDQSGGNQHMPKTRIAGGMFLTLEGNEKEPLGQRIIETPVNAEGTEVLRDARSGLSPMCPWAASRKARRW